MVGLELFQLLSEIKELVFKAGVVVSFACQALLQIGQLCLVEEDTVVKLFILLAKLS